MERPLPQHRTQCLRESLAMQLTGAMCPVPGALPQINRAAQSSQRQSQRDTTPTHSCHCAPAITGESHWGNLERCQCIHECCGAARNAEVCRRGERRARRTAGMSLLPRETRDARPTSSGLAPLLMLLCICFAALGSCAAVQVVPLNASQVYSLPPLPSAQVYDPPLPAGTAVQDALWLSYLPREGPLVPLSGEHVTSSGGVELLSGNASVQLGGWLRLDLHLNITSSTRIMVIESPMMLNVTIFVAGSAVTGCAAGVHAAPPAGGGSCGLVEHGGIGAFKTDSSTPAWFEGAVQDGVLVTLHAELGRAVGHQLRIPGQQLYAQPAAISPSVSSGYLHTCAIVSGGSLWCWG